MGEGIGLVRKRFAFSGVKSDPLSTPLSRGPTAMITATDPAPRFASLARRPDLASGLKKLPQEAPAGQQFQER